MNENKNMRFNVLLPEMKELKDLTKNVDSNENHETTNNIDNNEYTSAMVLFDEYYKLRNDMIYGLYLKACINTNNYDSGVKVSVWYPQRQYSVTILFWRCQFGKINQSSNK